MIEGEFSLEGDFGSAQRTQLSRRYQWDPRNGQEVWVNGRRLSMEVFDPRDLRPGQGAAANHGRQEIAASMPGKVIRVLVAAGDAVEEGQGLVVVEAMKMQNEMKSPKRDAWRKFGRGRMLRWARAKFWWWSSKGVRMAATAVCPICGGTGWKIIERAGLSGAEPCACAAEARAEALQGGSGIPPNYVRASLDNFQIPQDNPDRANGPGHGADAGAQLRARVPRRGTSRACCWWATPGPARRIWRWLR